MAQLNNSSVKSIIERCNEMIDIVEQHPHNDLRVMAKALKEECAEMQELFDNHPNSKELIKKKIKVEQLAIRLEFLISVWIGDFKDRRDLRREADELYQKCKNILFIVNNDSTPTIDLNEWILITKWALQFYQDSRHIGFVKDERDSSLIKKIHESPIYKQYAERL